MTQDSTKHKIIINTVWNIAGTIAMLLIGTFSSVVYVHYLGNDHYGVAVYITDMAILGVTLCSLGLGTYQSKVLQQLRTEEKFGKYKSVFFHNLKVRFLMVIASVAACAVAARVVPETSILKQHDALFFIAVFLVVQMALAVLRGPLQVEYQQKFLNLLDVASLVVRLMVVLVVIWFDYGILGFLLSELLVELLQLVLLGQKFLELVWPQLGPVAAEPYRQDTASSFSMYLVDLSNKVFGKEFDILLIGMLLGGASTPQVATYSLSFVLVTRLFSFLGLGTSSSATLIMNFVAELDVEGKRLQIAKFIDKQLKLIVFFVMPLMLGGVVLGGRILHLLYHGDLHEYSVINALFFVGYSVSALTYVSKPVLFVLGCEKRLLNVRVVFSVVKVLMLLVLIPLLGILGAAIVTTFILIVSSLAEYYLLGGCVRLEVPYKFIKKMLVANSAMFVVALVSSGMFARATVADVAVVIAVSVAVYGVALAAMKPIDEEDYQHICHLSLVKKTRLDRVLLQFTEVPKLMAKI